MGAIHLGLVLRHRRLVACDRGLGLAIVQHEQHVALVRRTAPSVACCSMITLLMRDLMATRGDRLDPADGAAADRHRGLGHFRRPARRLRACRCPAPAAVCSAGARACCAFWAGACAGACCCMAASALTGSVLVVAAPYEHGADHGHHQAEENERTHPHRLSLGSLRRYTGRRYAVQQQIRQRPRGLGIVRRILRRRRHAHRAEDGARRQVGIETAEFPRGDPALQYAGELLADLPAAPPHHRAPALAQRRVGAVERADRGGALREGLERGGNHLPQDRRRRRAFVGHPAHLGHQLVHRAVERLEEQVFLGTEIAIDRRLGDLGRLGQLVHLDFDIGPLREHLRGHQHDALPAVVATAGGERQGHGEIELPSFIGSNIIKPESFIQATSPWRKAGFLA